MSKLSRSNSSYDGIYDGGSAQDRRSSRCYLPKINKRTREKSRFPDAPHTRDKLSPIPKVPNHLPIIDTPNNRFNNIDKVSGPTEWVTDRLMRTNNAKHRVLASNVDAEMRAVNADKHNCFPERELLRRQMVVNRFCTENYQESEPESVLSPRENQLDIERQRMLAAKDETRKQKNKSKKQRS